jgi:hypothetical protein
MRLTCAVVFGLTLLSEYALARWYYPGGYGGYGWGGWGYGGGAVDPAAGYMAGLGAFARGQGVYEVESAKARAINFETMQKWNQALRARQQELQEEKRQLQAERDAQRDARVERMELEDGTTLNRLMMRILDFDPAVVRSSRAQAPLGASAIREIPFQWNTEALTICIDQLTGRAALPEPLTRSAFDAERAALGSADEAALQEDAKGDVSDATMKRLTAAINAFHDKFVKVVPKSDVAYEDCNDYFNTLASLSRMLHDPSMKKALAELDMVREVSVGELISFMQTYNLRFGPVTTGRQLEIYRTLVGLLQGVLSSVNAAPAAVPPPPPPGLAGKGLQDAAKNAFKGIGWPQLDAHAQQP